MSSSKLLLFQRKKVVILKLRLQIQSFPIINEINEIVNNQ